MGRMKSYKRDSYHVVQHSRPTPRLARVIIYLFIYLLTFYLLNLVSDRLSFARVLACFVYFLFIVFECDYFESRAV